MMSDSSVNASALGSVNIVCHPKGKSKVWKHFGFVENEKGKIRKLSDCINTS